MSERDTDVVGNPTMQIAKTAKEVRRAAAIKAALKAQIVAQQVRFSSNSAPGVGRQTEWKDDELGNPTRQIGDVKGFDPSPVMKRKLVGDLKWMRPRAGNGKFQ